MIRRDTPSALRAPPRLDVDDELESGARPTISPPFDVETFARDSEHKLRAFGGDSAVDGPELTASTFEDPLTEMRARFALGDHAGALDIAELILVDEPDNLDAAECGEDCRTALENELIAQLGSLDRVPTVGLPRVQLLGLLLDHRAGFVLSLVDGASTLEMILDVCSMPKLDGLQIVDELVRRKIVVLR